MCRVEPRKILVMISDGSPTDAATANVNRPGFLDDHLAGVAERIERSSPVELGAIGIDLDMAPYVRNSIDLDLAGTLTLQHYRALEQLFGSVRGSGANR
jgi:cobaltochelatase CobT